MTGRRSKPLVLVVEDEPDLREVIRYNLDREGFSVLESEDGEEGLDTLRRELPDLVLLDIMLPGVDGIELCRTIKYDKDTRGIPVIMVTARGDESDVVLGLGVGADDYITKPFSPRELVARVKAVLRRSRRRDDDAAGERIVRERLVIDRARHEVTVDGASVTLTPTEFRLLAELAARPGRVFTREQLLQRVMGDDVVVTNRNVDVHIRSVRKKLHAARDLIETIRGVGYRFHESEED
jgi:two-component system phosphate regulon response regulator PhoB